MFIIPMLRFYYKLQDSFINKTKCIQVVNKSHLNLQIRADRIFIWHIVGESMYGGRFYVI